jgi:hypothetical protein
MLKRRSTGRMLAALAIVALMSVLMLAPSPVLADGATQISGVGYWATASECNDASVGDFDFALRMTGDLEGCHYVFIETAECTPSGTYRETGTEVFVGQYEGEYGTFGTTYRFTAKYEDCTNLVGEILGRCQHPIADSSGDGTFEDVSGRLDFRDDIEAGTFPYTGHLRWQSSEEAGPASLAQTVGVGDFLDNALYLPVMLIQ